LTERYHRVVGDTESPIKDTLKTDGSAADISGFQQVQIAIEKPDETVITDPDAGNVNVIDAVNGAVEYAFAAGDLDQTGDYRYEWEITFGNGGVLTFPAESTPEIKVRDELA